MAARSGRTAHGVCLLLPPHLIAKSHDHVRSVERVGEHCGDVRLLEFRHIAALAVDADLMAQERPKIDARHRRDERDRLVIGIYQGEWRSVWSQRSHAR